MDSSFQTGKKINLTTLMRCSYLWRMKRFLFLWHCCEKFWRHKFIDHFKWQFPKYSAKTAEQLRPVWQWRPWSIFSWLSLNSKSVCPPGSIFQVVCSRLQRDFKLLLNLETLHLSDCVLIMISRFIFLKIVFFICCISLTFHVKLASVVAENNRKNDRSSHFLQLYPPE